MKNKLIVALLLLCNYVCISQTVRPPRKVTVDNPTTLVTIGNPTTTVTVANPVTSVGINGTPTVTVTNQQTNVAVTGYVVAREKTLAYVRKNEGREIPIPVMVSTAASAYNNIFGGAFSGRNWLTAVNSGTLAANTSYSIPNLNLQPEPGRKYVIRRISVSGSLDGAIELQKQIVLAGTLYGKTGTIIQGTLLQQFYKYQFTPTGGEVSFEFPADDPLILKTGERLLFYYSRPGTAIPNFIASVTGKELTNDDNDTAPIRGLFFGDSRTFVTPDGIPQTQSDLGHFIIKDSLSAYGFNNQVVNIATGGTDVSDWDYLGKCGRFDGIPFSYAVINLGSNDALVGTWLSSGGNDGAFKTGLKNIARRLHSINPDAPIFINSIGPTDIANRQANLAAYRSEISQTVIELNAKGIPARLCDISNSFPTTDKSNYVVNESGVGASLHESSKGQKANALIIWSVIKANLSLIKQAK